jgi:hypothetical protein
VNLIVPSVVIIGMMPIGVRMIIVWMPPVGVRIPAMPTVAAPPAARFRLRH